jgi:hypothetical protein
MFDTSSWNGGAQVTQTVQRGIAAVNSAQSPVSNFVGNAAQQALRAQNLPSNVNNAISNTARNLASNGMANVGATIGNSLARGPGSAVGSLVGSNIGAQLVEGSGGGLRIPSNISGFAANAAQRALGAPNLATNVNHAISNTARNLASNGMANVGTTIGNSLARGAGSAVGSLVGSNIGAQLVGGNGSGLRIPSNLSGFAANSAQQALGFPMPLNGFRNTLTNTVMRTAANLGGTAGGMLGQALGGNVGGGIGAALGSGTALNAGAQLLGGNGLNMQMPWNSSNPIPGMNIGAWLGGILSNTGFSIPEITIPGLGQGANGAISGAINGAVGGALGGALGSVMNGGGNMGSGAIAGAVGGAIGGSLGGSSFGGMGGISGISGMYNTGGSGMGSGGSGMGMGIGSIGRSGPDGFSQIMPRGGMMPTIQNPMNGGMQNPFGGQNGNPFGNIGNTFGSAVLNVVVQTVLQQFGISPGGFGQGFGGGLGTFGSMVGGLGQGASPGNVIPGTFTNAIVNRIGESTFNIPGTQNGNYACAWVVNDIYKQVTGRTITGAFGSSGSSNMLVKDTIAAMQSSPQAFRQVTQAEAINSGRDYIIASNYDYGGRGSHIGWANGNTVWSNSSGRASIQQNYSAATWENNYGRTLYFIPQ